MKDRIEGKVAKILNQRELVINRGETAGVEVGMQFAVLNPKGLAIRDPDTGNEIGSVEIPKVVVKIVRVQENLSTARTFRTSLAGFLPLFDIARSMGSPRVVPETLRTDEAWGEAELDEAESMVKTGDVIVEVVGDEFDSPPDR